MSPPTTHTLRLTMNGSAGLKVVILVADSGQVGDLAQRIEQRLEHEAVEERRDEHADGRRR